MAKGQHVGTASTRPPPTYRQAAGLGREPREPPHWAGPRGLGTPGLAVGGSALPEAVSGGHRPVRTESPSLPGTLRVLGLS